MVKIMKISKLFRCITTLCLTIASVSSYAMMHGQGGSNIDVRPAQDINPHPQIFETNIEAAHIYQEANAVKSRNSHRAIIDAYNFSGIKTLTDVGGGLGTLLALILEANRETQGIDPCGRRK